MKSVVHPNLKANPAPAVAALAGGLVSKRRGARMSAHVAEAASHGTRWMGSMEAAG